jgi:P pilus assembly chaperone PapD
MLKIFNKIFLILFLVSTNNAFASKISLGTVIVDFNSEKKKKFVDVTITNVSKEEKAYVQVTIKEILNSGTKDAKRADVKKGDKNSLIVSPQKLIIEPNGKKNIRFVNLNKNLKKDRIYRVNVAPVVGGVDAKSKNFIKVLIAYDVLVMVRPENQNSDFVAKKEGKKITFTNKGNTNVLFRKAVQCPKDSSKECVKISGNRLYAGGEFSKDLPFDTKVTYTYSTGSKLETATY